MRLANELEVGLGSSVWSSDREKALAVAARLEAGTTWINSHGGLHPMIPFGGIKQSGYGREFGVEGLNGRREPARHQRLGSQGRRTAHTGAPAGDSLTGGGSLRCGAAI